MDIPRGTMAVDDIRLAACFLTFGATHRTDTPVWRARSFDYDELIKADREGRKPKCIDVVIYYVDGLDIGQARAITKAFHGTDASEAFHAFVDGLGDKIDSGQRAQLYALHSNALAQTCREVEEKRAFWEYL